MSQSSVASDLLHSFQIFSELGVDSVGEELGPVAVADVSLSVQEPLRNVVVYRAVRGGARLPVGLAKISLTFSMSASFSSPALQTHMRKAGVPLVEVDLGDLEHEVGESSTDTLDGVEGEHGLAFTVDVCVLDSQNVSEFLSLDQLD